jgi:hypothetical protein
VTLGLASSDDEDAMVSTQATRRDPRLGVMLLRIHDDDVLVAA